MFNAQCSMVNAQMRTRKFIFYISNLLLLSACSKGQVQQREEDNEFHEENVVELSDQQASTIGIEVGEMERRQLSGIIKATGTLNLSPQDKADVTSLVTGITRNILVKEGQCVRQGQTLALVENTEIVALQKEYYVCCRQLDLLHRALQRQESLHAEGAGTEKEFEKAKAELDMMSATERGLRLQLDQLGISNSEVAKANFSRTVPVPSPITGVVGEILVSTGSYLGSETVLMKVYDNRALHADLNVFETDIARIHVGQEVTMQLSDQAATLLTGKVAFITATLDKESKSASVHINLDGAEGVTLLPGMFVSAAIHQDEQTCDAVPDEAVVMKAGRKYVFVSLGAGRFLRREVVTGLTGQGYTQITFADGTKPDGGIVTRKAFYLESTLEAQ